MEHVNQETGEVTLGIDKLGAALVEAQKAAKAVGKDKTNDWHKYKYASAEAMIEEARGALTAAGLSFLTLGWELRGDRTEKSVGRVHVDYRLLHTSGQYVDMHASTPVIPEKGRPEDKAELGAITANLSYMLRGLLLLPRDDDATSIDGRNDTAHEPAKAPPEEKSDPKSDDLAAQYVDEIGKLEMRFGTEGDAGARFKILQELEAIATAVKGLTLPKPAKLRIVGAYNPVVLAMRQALNIGQAPAAPSTAAAE